MGQLLTFQNEAFFIDALAHYLLTHYTSDHDPATLASVRVLLPNQRGITALKRALFQTNNQQALLLPAITTLGNLKPSDWLPPDYPEISALPPAVNAMERQIWLAEWLLENTSLHHHFPSPPTIAQTLDYTESLLALRDDCRRANVSTAALHRLVSNDYAEHWQDTISIYTSAMAYLDQRLVKTGFIEPLTYESQVMHIISQYWLQYPPSTPIVAAGSTAADPTTALLLKTLLSLPQGRVILPGLDMDMPEQEWDTLETTHAQYTMKQFLIYLEQSRRQVHAINVEGQERDSFIHRTMSQHSASSYQPDRTNVPQSVDGLYLQEVDDDIAEVETVALLIRHQLEQGHYNILIVSDQDCFVRRLRDLLHDLGITINHSAGIPVEQHPAYRLMMLVAELLYRPYASVTLLSLLRHPMCFPDCSDQLQDTIHLLDHRLRGWHAYRSVSDAIHAITTDATSIDDRVRTKLEWLATQCDRSQSVTLQQMIDIHLETLRYVCGIMHESNQHKNEALACLMKQLETWQEHLHTHTTCPTHEYHNCVAQLFRNVCLPVNEGSDSSIHIIGALESRLQKADVVIVPHMNEGHWPKPIHHELWLNNAMRRQLGLDFVQRRIGLAAHDLSMLLKAPQIHLVRARKEQGAPTQPSRFFQRLQLGLSMIGVSAAPCTPPHWLKQWRQSFIHYSPSQPVMQPHITPLLDSRPTRLSATTIETLMDNPFAVYVSAICGLRMRDPYDENFNAQHFGSTLHRAMEKAAEAYDPPQLERYQHSLQQHIIHSISTHVPAGERHFHCKRLERTMATIMVEESRRATSIDRLSAEQQLERTFTTPQGDITLHARVDRLEERHDGSLWIIDYKTGTIPSAKDVWDGKRSQLLVAAITTIHPDIGGLEYWMLSGKHGETLLHTITPASSAAEGDFREEITEKLLALADYYCHHPEALFVWNTNNTNPKHYELASHLARVGEW